MESPHLIACHDCDLLQQMPPLSAGESLRCVRCKATLLKRGKHSLNFNIALVLTSLILFVIANSFPFMSLNSQGQIVDTTLLSGAVALYQSGNILLCALVLLTIFVFPLLNILGLMYVLVSQRLRRGGKDLSMWFRILRYAKPWAMLEVLLLAVLVAGVKLGDLAIVIPGAALYSFALLIIFLSAIDSSIDPLSLWQRNRMAEQ